MLWMDKNSNDFENIETQVGEGKTKKVDSSHKNVSKHSD